jgi:uncharacterized protein (DUF111 family)
MKTMYIECNMGAAGDMLMAALLELLPESDSFINRMNQLGIPGVTVSKETSVKCGITGTHIRVMVRGEEEESLDISMGHGHHHDHSHHHGHSHGDKHAHEHTHDDHDHHHKDMHDHEHAHDDHGHHHAHDDHGHHHAHNHHHTHDHGHVGMAEIEDIVNDLPLSDKVKGDVLAVYGLIAEAESKAHGKPVETVHFHEVGMMDAVADIVGVCLLMEELAPQRVIVSPIHVGSGQVKCAHGILPVPAPATAYLLKGVPTYGGRIEGELCTPTGAALLKHFADEFGDRPVMATESIGYGMGKKDFPAANCVRIFLGETKWQSMSAGILKMPVVLRVSVGSKYGAQHSQDWTSLCAHIPGLKVVFPATPYDAKGLMNSALMGTDPVVFFESQRIYDIGEMFNPAGVPEGYYEVPIGEPDIKREGEDITILTIGATLYRALEAADRLYDDYGLSAEIIDARSLVPFNYEKVIESVRRTGRILLASDACERGSYLNDLAQNISEMAFDYLDAPPVVLGAKNWITPAFELEEYFFPQPDWFLDIIHERILPLDGHVVKNNFTKSEQIRYNKYGI